MRAAFTSAPAPSSACAVTVCPSRLASMRVVWVGVAPKVKAAGAPTVGVAVSAAGAPNVGSGVPVVGTKAGAPNENML